MNHTTPDPQTLAKQTLAEIDTTFEQNSLSETSVLDALQTHYTTLQQNQELYISYLTEIVERLKTTQHADKESLAQLKKEVLKHILTSAKK